MREPTITDCDPQFTELQREATDTADSSPTSRYPAADVYILGQTLRDWGLDEKKEILSKVADATNAGGLVVVNGTILPSSSVRR